VYWLNLPRAVAPGETIQIEITWENRYPKVFARSGWSGNFLMSGQWFPKVGVWWHNAWNCHQFHATTEFFADFGTFDVKLTVPQNYVLGSTGDTRRWFAKAAPGPCMVQVDTGMNRLGLKPRELAGVAETIRSHPKAIAAWLTHFASADDVDLGFCRDQVARFEAAIAALPPAPRSIVNSSGLYLGVPEWRQAFTRPGKALAGINPMPPGEVSPVWQAMTVTAPILQVSDVARGDSIGYSATFRAARPMRVATLGIGYSNGYLRSLSNRGIVAFGGKRAPVVGRVSMDLVTVDVTGLGDAALADGFGEMLGPTIGLTELAGLAGTNEYEMQISLGRGCKRDYLESRKT